MILKEFHEDVLKVSIITTYVNIKGTLS